MLKTGVTILPFFCSFKGHVVIVNKECCLILSPVVKVNNTPEMMEQESQVSVFIQRHTVRISFSALLMNSFSDTIQGSKQ